MGLFDSIKNKPTAAAPTGTDNKTVEVVFSALPDTLEQFKALPQAAMRDPFDTAALTVLAFCFYPQDRELSLAMVDYLRGPRPLSPYDKQFIRDRFMDKDYVPRSYFKGAYSYAEPNYCRLFLRSGGADNPREVKLRLAKDGKWYLWEQMILVGIREPESANPWA